MKKTIFVAFVLFLFSSPLLAMSTPKNRKDPASGKWRFETTTNPIDDSKSYVIMLAADEGENSWGRPIGLALRCQNKRAEFFIFWNEYLGDNAEVTIRYDKAKPENDFWQLSNDKTATFYPRDVHELVKKLLITQKFAVQITPYMESPQTAVFDVRFLKNVVQHFYKDCPEPVPPAVEPIEESEAKKDCFNQMNAMMEKLGFPLRTSGSMEKDGNETWFFKSSPAGIRFTIDKNNKACIVSDQ